MSIINRFLFETADVTKGWLSLLDAEGVNRCVRLNSINAIEYSATVLTILTDAVTWHIGSGINQAPDLSLNVHNERRDALRLLFDKIIGELTR